MAVVTRAPAPPASVQDTRASLAPPRPRHLDAFHFGAAGLVLLTIATRLPFMTDTLYAFDSANYALAVRDFYNVAFHQPHPPGYPLYVLFARLVNLAVGDANRALVLEGIAWSALAVGCTIGVARAMFGRRVGLLAGLLLLCTVGFWGYGEVAYPYVALAGETAALALLAQRVIAGRPRWFVGFAIAWAVALGTRWDAAIFCLPLAVWAALRVGLRVRAAAVGTAALIVAAWAVPMILASGGWDAYRQAVSDYLKVWSPQSAYVVGDFASGGDTQATYNLNFLVNYLRQMLGVGLVLVLYVLGRRFGPARLAGDYRSRFLAVWVVPPVLVYVFAHLGESGYVLSLAPQAALLVGLAIFDLRDEVTVATQLLAARGWRWLPAARPLGGAVASVLALGILGWNVQAFARGVGPGRLPDLRAHDATTSAQVEFLRQQPANTTVVLAHDIVRQLQFYKPGPQVTLLYSEYVPSFETARTVTALPSGTEQVVALDPLVGPSDAREIVLREQPRVSVWVFDARGARAVEHGYRFVRLITD